MSDVTPPLDEFLARFEEDDNEWWTLSCGHHLNLFEDAVERMQEAERILARLIIPSEAFVVPAETPAEIVLDEDERGGR